jgi:beta-N-acetylhexosaminidase
MLRRLRSLIWLGAFVALILLAWKVRTPYARRFGGYEAGLVVLGAAALAITSRKPRGFWRMASLGAIAVYALREEVVFRGARERVHAAPPAQLARLGKHIVVGFQDLEEVEDLARRGAIGGVFVTHRNIRGKNVEEARAMIDRLREAAAHEPFFVAADQEGGEVSRLSPPLPYRAALGNFASAPLEDVRAHAEAQAIELASIGVDVNLSPVLDLKRDRGLDPLDFHSKISDRAISGDPTITAGVGAAYVRGLESQGVIGTLKHFPGLGRADGDTHHFDLTIDTPREELEETDFLPFRRVLAETNAFLMLGHVVLPAIDDRWIVTQSKAVIGGLIRDSWAHQGVLITDDVCMGPFYSAPGGVGRSSVRALNAGVDLLLVGYDERQYYRVMAALLDADDAGELDAAERAGSIVRLNRTAEYRSFIRASTIVRGNSGA